MRVLICGSESYNDKQRLERILRDLDSISDTVVTMGRRGHGADDAAFYVCDKLGLLVHEMPQNSAWQVTEHHSTSYRNNEFLRLNYDGLDMYKAELCIACTSSIHCCEEAKDMADRCKARGIRFISTTCGW